MDMERQKRLISAGNFIENNGSVLRTINILRHEYHKLKSVKYALPNISEGEIIDSVNYLSEAGYIRLRNIETKALADLADTHFEDLEAKLTGNGIRLLAGAVIDPCIDI